MMRALYPFATFVVSFGCLVQSPSLAWSQGERGEVGATPAPTPVVSDQLPLRSSEPSASPSASPTKDPLADLPKTGVLSEVGTGGGGKGIPTWTNESLDSDAVSAPVTGSISRKGQKDWNLAVANNTEKDSFSVTVRVYQLNKSNSTVKSDTFSYSLKPGAREDRTVAGSGSAVGARVVLENIRRLNSK